ncbi:alpha/beta hydrolase [Glutamicibacter uratoxydans]|uniref:alpha/beta hydrolase n=1 Tax=Glutamicibacter uratoxydans TaxID=43667 RepID=UPI003D6DAF22
MKQPVLLPSAQWADYGSSSGVGQWLPDPLGPEYSYTTLDFGFDAEGPAVATVVRYQPAGLVKKLLNRSRGVVLSLHGWSDYFYNRQLAEFWHELGYHFYALDLRRYGRSLRAEHELPGYTDDLSEYDQEINAAYDLIRDAHPKLPILFMGHSLGGLVLSLWAQRSTRKIDGLVLNAPWLEFQGTQFLRVPAQTILEPMVKRSPRRKLHLPELDHYWTSLSRDGSGEWDLHPLWRPRYAFRPTTGWMRTVLEGHAQVAKGLDLSEPIVVLTSEKSHFSASYDQLMQRTDSIVDVNLVRQRSLKLGRFVTNLTVPEAMHDVFTSAEPARAMAYRNLACWVRMLQH